MTIDEKFIYGAKIPNEDGTIDFSKEEHETWGLLYKRQINLLENRACDEFIQGAHKLNLSSHSIPQLTDISHILYSLTGWQMTPVKALISFKEFFELLSKKKFPAATFIRRRQDIDYLKEPDIFHEIFGHASMLTNKEFANFTHRVGEIGLSMTKSERAMLARLYWFTVEFGLINTPKGIRIYGGGILSSKNETIYSLESNIPKRTSFDLIKVLTTPYRYDELQKQYFIVDSFQNIFDILSHDLSKAFKLAQERSSITKEETDIRSC